MKRFLTIALVVITASCVDRIDFDIARPADYGIAISGYISDQPGPYVVKIYTAFDIDSKEEPRKAYSGVRVSIVDENGLVMPLKENEYIDGQYETAADVPRGRVGGIYKLLIEYRGRKFESLPDTMRSTGRIDDLTYSIRTSSLENRIQILTKSSLGEKTQESLFMWTSASTYKADTNPAGEARCYFVDGFCGPNPCIGLGNVGTQGVPVWAQVRPCTCCTCWYTIYQKNIFLSDEKRPDRNGVFEPFEVDHLTISEFLMKYKVRISVSINSLSPQSFRFWKSIRDQRNAINNIFQPVTGKQPTTFVHTGGEDGPVPYGLFYATSMNTRVMEIRNDDIDKSLIPPIPSPKIYNVPCYNFQPNASRVQPLFWTDN